MSDRVERLANRFHDAQIEDDLLTASAILNETARSLNSDHILTLRMKAWLAYRQDDLVAARKACNQILLNLPHDDQVQQYLVLIDIADKKYDPAVQRLRKLQLKNPQDKFNETLSEMLSASFPR
ncbi:hypothetical protein FSC37_22300 [Piscinibacter aquaticus]|uniref:Tetratricopeptide repeat protein n=1 Tax=Piscinibacter aquaticus TaxID=392597 RepID=A0A5C6TR09_9BURK|nr:hypothetical protein FSC37_22300 [Piscinibacter aquaticus]